MSNKSTILVTGGAGYIGSHTVQALQKSGYNVIILDNLVHGHQDIVETVLKVPLIVGDINDRSLLDEVFSSYSIDAVMHFSAYLFVSESVTDPAKYYRNNVVGTLTLLEAMMDANIQKFVFSSTCATYGLTEKIPITEAHSQNPMNPYGQTKLMVEQILKDFDIAYGLKYVCFRYFNASGAAPDGSLGEDHHPEPHLIPLILQTALGIRDSISIFGTDYDTHDGTCIRDYIHVVDLAKAHILGLEYLLQGKESESFNLGNGNGFSVQEVIEIAKAVTGKEISVKIGARRTGDPPCLVGSNEKAKKILGWQPKYGDIKDIVTHAWQWHQKRHSQ